MKNKWTFGWILLVFLACFACTGKSSDTPTNPLLNEQTMLSFLIDLHLNEAFINEHYAPNTESSWLFLDLFNKYHITPQQFDDAILYYKNDHKTYLSIYQQVTEELNKEVKRIDSGIYRYYYPPIPSIWTYYGVIPKSDSTLAKYTDHLFYQQLPAAEFRTNDGCSYPYIKRFRGKAPYWKIGN